MTWYVVHTKPRQEARALEHLERQGFDAYLPLLPAERAREGAVTLQLEPLFPRYLFLRAEEGRSIAAVRSTQGVNRLVSFGLEPARVDDRLIQRLREREARDTTPRRLFVVGETVRIESGPFAGLDAVYQMREGERRALVLIEFMSCRTPLAVSPSSLRKLS